MKTSQDDHREDETQDVDLRAMLYLAGELEAGEHQRFEAGLAGDRAAQARVASWVALDGLLRGDAATAKGTPADSRHALARSLQLVRRHAEAEAGRPALRLGAGPRVSLPRWAWGTAVAALLAVAFVVWVTNTDPPQLTVAKRAVENERGEGLAAAFNTVELATEQETGHELEAQIQTQVDALGILATMNEPGLNDVIFDNLNEAGDDVGGGR